MSESIADILAKRGAWLKGVSSDQTIARNRSFLTHQIAEQFLVFEQLRDHLLQSASTKSSLDLDTVEICNDTARRLIEEMATLDIIELDPTQHSVTQIIDRRYLSGGWLEELAWLAAYQAGMEEALHGQLVNWSVKGYNGENEIDVIVRKQSKLGFVSCKALRSALNIQDRKHRNRLMDTVHEADNIADHFGRPGEPVAVLVTTDLYDEARAMPRYVALMGKAAALDVHVIALEDLAGDRLVTALSDMMLDKQEVGNANSHL